jgi:nicotinate-nucleotide adenylyltransferase
VWFIPAAVQPFKRSGPLASDADRARMIELAIADQPRMRLSRIELDRGGVSYTIDTVRRVKRLCPERRLALIMGEDTLADLPNWRAPRELLALVTPLVVARSEAPPLDLMALSLHSDAASDEPVFKRVQMPAVDVSSTLIRQRLATGQPVDDLTPRAVAAYLAERRLYRNPAAPTR